jgi:DNA-binding MarR family transcriptional regulator
MSQLDDADPEKARLLLSLLESVERDETVSQRRLAAELGIALGLVNAYLKRCIKKGWVKISEVPARRYSYYLTPHGFAEKSRLTAEFLSYSFSFFREARGDCAAALAAARADGYRRIALAGISDLAEIATICALDNDLEVVGAVEPRATEDRFLGVPVLSSWEAAAGRTDAALLTDLRDPAGTLDRAVQALGRERVFVPALLAGRMRRAAQARQQVEAAE